MLRRKSELDNKLQRQKNPSPLNIRKYFTNSNSSLFRKIFLQNAPKESGNIGGFRPVWISSIFKKYLKN